MSQRDIGLKVMRLSRPTLVPKAGGPLTDDQLLEELGLRGDDDIIDHGERDDGPITSLLTLPPSFGHIYLGETFRGYVCVTNEDQAPLASVNATIEMQVGAGGASQRGLLLLELNDHHIPSGGSCQGVANHDVNQLGPHVLVVTVNFKKQELDEEQTLRKFYKFAALNPLNVRTKVHTTPAFPLPPVIAQEPEAWHPSSTQNVIGARERKVYLEVQIQNLTHQAINLERLALECAPGWVLCDSLGLNELLKDVVCSKNIVQILYSLAPSKEGDMVSRTTPNLGRLDIVWRGVNGESGRLLTSMLGRRVPQHVLDMESAHVINLKVSKAPRTLKKHVPFDVEFVLEVAQPLDRVLLLDAVLRNYTLKELPSQLGCPLPAPTPNESCFPIGNLRQRLVVEPGQKEVRWTFSWCVWGSAAEPIIRPGSMELHACGAYEDRVLAKMDVVAEIELEA